MELKRITKKAVLKYLATDDLELKVANNEYHRYVYKCNELRIYGFKWADHIFYELSISENTLGRYSDKAELINVIKNIESPLRLKKRVYDDIVKLISNKEIVYACIKVTEGDIDYALRPTNDYELFIERYDVNGIYGAKVKLSLNGELFDEYYSLDEFEADVLNAIVTHKTESVEGDEIVRYCSECGEILTDDDNYVEIDGEWYCRNCVYYCEHCGRYHVGSEDELIDVRVGYRDNYEQWCENCVERNAYKCSDCGDYFSTHDVDYQWVGYGGERVVCSYCYDHGDYYYCECCDNIVTGDDWDSDNDCCIECSGGDLIASYHYSPRIKWFGKIKKSWRGLKRGCGIELEIDTHDRDRDSERELIYKLREIAPDELYFQHDGSLDEGFEIITQPHTFDAMYAMPWADILESCRNYGYKSHDIGTCGLHIHVSRNAFGSTYDKQSRAIAKVINFYETYWSDFVKASRRSNDTASRWADRFNIHGDNEFKRCKCEEISKDKRSYDRYHAINLRNEYTVEFRLGRGTLKYDSFMAWVDLHITLVKNSVRIKWSDVDNVNEWFKGIKTETIEYLKSVGAFASVLGGVR